MEVVYIAELMRRTSYDARASAQIVSDSVDALAGLAVVGRSCASRTNRVTVGTLLGERIGEFSSIAGSSALIESNLQIILSSIRQSVAFGAAG